MSTGNMDGDPMRFLREWIACSPADEAELRSAFHGRVADIGGGSGSRIDPCSRLAISDLEPELAVVIDRHFAERPRHGRRVKADIDAAGLPFDDDSFDVAVCMHVLEHITQPRSVLAEIRRVVGPRGWLLVAVPNGWSLSDNFYKLWKLVFRIFKGEKVPHVQRFTRRTMTHLLVGAGFQVHYVARIGETWEWMSRHPRIRHMLGAMTRLLEKVNPEVSSYGWLFIGRKDAPPSLVFPDSGLDTLGGVR
jgi:ubiquinone/menaquinone biosynthesis C-methylase UbiE